MYMNVGLITRQGRLSSLSLQFGWAPIGFQVSARLFACICVVPYRSQVVLYINIYNSLGIAVLQSNHLKKMSSRRLLLTYSNSVLH